jgi:glutamine phosphoribosylpyrophosphate amidotransferase
VGEMALAMNGVLHMGTKEEFEKAFGVSCLVDNDSEVFLQRLAAGQDAAEFISSITGSFAATWLIGEKLFAGRNARRPLWRCEALGARWVVSTEDIFRRAGVVGAVEMTPGVEMV